MSLEHKAHILSLDLGGGKCSSAGWLQWDSVGCKDLGMLRGSFLVPFRVLHCWGRAGAGAESHGSAEGTARGAGDEVFISVD